MTKKLFLRLRPSHHNNWDCLRGMAVLAVMAHHLKAYSGFEIPFLGDYGGLLGVQLFFIISGYLIVQSALTRPSGQYLAHRFFRVFPAYWLVIFSLLALRLWLDPRLWDTVSHHWPHLAFNVLNLQQFSVPSLFLLDQIHVGWTLTVEWLWYLVALLCAVAMGRRAHPRAWLILLALSGVLSVAWTFAAQAGKLDFLVARQFAQTGIPLNPQTSWALLSGNIFGHLFFFMLGACIQQFEPTLTRLNSSVLWLGVAIGVLLIESWQNGLGLMPQPVSGLGLACLVLLLLKARPVQDWVLNRVGKLSYSLYLLHAPVWVLVFVHFQFNGLTAVVWSTGLIFALATLLFLAVEQPMIDLGRQWSTPRPPTASDTPSGWPEVVTAQLRVLPPLAVAGQTAAPSLPAPTGTP